ncbi:LuxR C-terminal-related transcriptional regulator [Streptomyces sp. NPDC127084]|uniref:LuxR C-terminal-related transcriptional regulator n=1 Tax=Streptomyces sp. NPDC127084 TaxID=3347133 RepID=UPI0036668A69
MDLINLEQRWPLVGRERELHSFIRSWEGNWCGAFVICGAAGVGKTRLAEECIERIRGEKAHIGRATASKAAAAVPLGAIAHLLPSGVDTANPVEGFAAVTRNLSESGRRRWVLFIDDLHLLDDTSVMLLRQLVDARALRLITTVRTGERIGHAVEAFMSGEVHCVELNEFNRSTVECILEQVLGGPVGKRTVNILFMASGGNALYLHELVHGAALSGRLRNHGEVWELVDGDLPSTWQLTELIKGRLSAAPPEGRPVLELLALCGAMSLDHAEFVAAPSVVADLEDKGLIHAVMEGRRVEVSLAHPLYGEVLRDGLPAVRSRHLLEEQAERTEAWGCRRRQDALNIANWRLSATGTAEPELLLQGAALARHSADYRQAIVLLNALPKERHTVSSLLQLGASLFESGASEQAEETLKSAAELARTNEERLQAIFIRSMNLSWACDRVTDALALNDAALKSLTGPADQRMLRMLEGCLRLMIGESERGLRLLRDLEDEPATSPNLGIWLMASLLKPAALSAVGRCQEAVEFAERAYEQRCGLSDPMPLVLFGKVAYLISLVNAYNSAGRLSEAREISEQAWEGLRETNDPVLPWILLPYHQANTDWMSGNVSAAYRWYAESVTQGRSFNNYRMMRRALSGLAAAAALQGEISIAEAAQREALTYPPSYPPEREEHLAEAWLLAAHGRLSDARTVLTNAAQSARDAGWWSTEAQLLTDVARLGGAKSVVHRLAELADECDGELIAACARLAAALESNDPVELFATANALEAIGLELLAAEAAMAASAAWRSAGESRRSTSSARQATAYAARCGNVQTPLLQSAAPAVAPLTRREREIARMAADRITSKEIAAALHLSPRTVNNHLHQIYAKLGIASRRQLPGAFHVGG